MTNLSPTSSSTPTKREMIGTELFSQRRETFDKHDTVFLPSPVLHARNTAESDGTTSLKRNTASYSSMRESKTSDFNHIYRPRKYSENSNTESDNFEHRYGISERSLRLYKMRKEFLSANMHGSASENTFGRCGTRSSLPGRSASVKYKIDSPNLFKFPFAEPFATPQTVRKIASPGLDETDGKDHTDLTGNKENHEPVKNSVNQLDPHQQFEELVRRYSPQRKPVDWHLPPTKPKTPKQESSSVNNSLDQYNNENKDTKKKLEGESAEKLNGILAINGKNKATNDDSRISLAELDEKNDEVPELTTVHRQIRDLPIKSKEKVADLRIPALLEKMSAESDKLETKDQVVQKKKRKRSFLDKLLGRNKGK